VPLPKLDVVRSSPIALFCENEQLLNRPADLGLFWVCRTGSNDVRGMFLGIALGTMIVIAWRHRRSPTASF